MTYFGEKNYVPLPMRSCIILCAGSFPCLCYNWICPSDSYGYEEYILYYTGRPVVTFSKTRCQQMFYFVSRTTSCAREYAIILSDMRIHSKIIFCFIISLHNQHRHYKILRRKYFYTFFELQKIFKFLLADSQLNLFF